MRELLAGAAIFAAAFCTHLVLWRLHPPRRQIKALLRVFYGTFAAAVCLDAVSGAAALDPEPGAALRLLLFYTGLTLCYIITYQAVQVDSPSLVIVSAIAAAGPRGVGRDELLAQLTDDVLVRPRLLDLVRDEVVGFDGTRYRMRPRGGRMLAVITGWRRLMGLPIRGG